MSARSPVAEAVLAALGEDDTLLVSEAWSDEARAAAYLARMRRLRPGGAGVLLDHGVRVTKQNDGKINVSSPHSLTEHQPSEEKAVDAVFRHQHKATRKPTERWRHAVTAAAHRSVKAGNLRTGHVLHHEGKGSAVAGVRRVPGTLSGETVSATLADGTTVTLSPEDRVSVTSPVEEAVRSVLLSTTEWDYEDAVRHVVAESTLRDKAATRQRWVEWELRHGLTDFHDKNERVRKVEAARRVDEKMRKERAEAERKAAQERHAEFVEKTPRSANYDDTPEGMGQFVHDYIEHHDSLDSISQMHPELDRFSEDTRHKAYTNKHVRPTNDGYGWGSTRGYVSADFHDKDVRGGIVTKWRKADEPALTHGKGQREGQHYKASRDYRERNVADKVSMASPHKITGLDKARLAKYTKPIPEAMTLHHGSGEDFLAHIGEGETGHITGHLSFTGHKPVATAYGHNTVYHVEAPKGTKTFRPTDVNKMFPGEDEHVLLKNTRIHVTKREKKADGTTHVYAKIVKGGGSKVTEAELRELAEWLVESGHEVVEALIQEADVNAVEAAVREHIEEAGLRTGGSLRDRSASRLRWIKWEKSHGMYKLPGTRVEPRMLEELPRGQRLRLASGNEVHRNDDGSFDLHLKTDGSTLKGITAQRAANQAAAIEHEEKRNPSGGSYAGGAGHEEQLAAMKHGETKTIGGIKVERAQGGSYVVHHPADSPRGQNAGGKVSPDAYLLSPKVAADSLASARRKAGPKSGDKQYPPGYTQAAADYEEKTKTGPEIKRGNKTLKPGDEGYDRAAAAIKAGEDERKAARDAKPKRSGQSRERAQLERNKQIGDQREAAGKSRDPDYPGSGQYDANDPKIKAAEKMDFKPADWDTGAGQNFGRLPEGRLFSRNSSVYVKVGPHHGFGVHGKDKGARVAHSGTVIPLKRKGEAAEQKNFTTVHPPHTSHIKSLLGDGATVREGKNGGYAIGGFSMPPKQAQEKLRAAGYDVKDNFGQTEIHGGGTTDKPEPKAAAKSFSSPEAKAKNAARLEQAKKDHPVGSTRSTTVHGIGGKSGEVSGEVVDHKRGSVHIKTKNHGTLAVEIDKVKGGGGGGAGTGGDSGATSEQPDPRAWKKSKLHYIERDPKNPYKVRDWKRDSEDAPWKVGPSRTKTQSETAALIPRYKGAEPHGGKSHPDFPPGTKVKHEGKDLTVTGVNVSGNLTATDADGNHTHVHPSKVTKSGGKSLADSVKDGIKGPSEKAGGPASGTVHRPLRQIANGKGDSLSQKRKQDLVNRGFAKWDGPGKISLTDKGKQKIQEADYEVGTSMVEAAVRAHVSEAADSLIKASTPEPFSKSKTSNWVARGGGLPAYIQHIAHDLMEKRGKSESNAIQMAIGIVKRWAKGLGKVDANTRAAAAKAVAEWEALKAKAKARKAVTEHELRIYESWFEDEERAHLLVAEAEFLERNPDLLVLEADSTADHDDDTGKMNKGKRSDGMKVKCPKCNSYAIPRDGKCPNGHNVAHLAKFAKRLKGKVSEGEERSELTDAILAGLEG